MATIFMLTSYVISIINVIKGKTCQEINYIFMIMLLNKGAFF